MMTTAILKPKLLSQQNSGSSGGATGSAISVPSGLPGAVQATIPTGFDGLMVYTGYRPAEEGYHGLWVKQNATSYFCKARRYRGLPLMGAAGDTFAFGAWDARGNDLAGVSVTTVPFKQPRTLQRSQAVNVSIVADHVVIPDKWTPETDEFHVWLNNDADVIHFPSAAGPRWVFIRELDDAGVLTPVRAYMIRAGRTLNVFCPLRRVFVATSTGAAINAKFDGEMVGVKRSIWYPEFSATPATITNLATLKTFLQDDTEGRVGSVTAAGTITLDADIVLGSGSYSQKGFLLRNDSGGAVEIALSSFRFAIVRPGSVTPCVLDGIDFDVTGSSTGLEITTATVWIHDFEITGAPSSAVDSVNITYTGATVGHEVIFSVGTLSDAVADGFNGTYNSTLPDGSRTVVAGLSASFAGSASNSQLLTAHGLQGFEILCPDITHTNTTGALVANGTGGAPDAASAKPLSYVMWGEMDGIVDSCCFFDCHGVITSTVLQWQVGDSSADLGYAYVEGGYYESNWNQSNKAAMIQRFASGDVSGIEIAQPTSTGGARGVNLRGSGRTEYVLASSLNAGYAVQAGFGSTPTHVQTIRNCGGTKGAVSYTSTNYDYTLDVRNCLSDQNVANNFTAGSSEGLTDITSDFNVSRTAFNANWPAGSDDAVADTDVDASTLMPAADETVLLEAGDADNHGYDAGGYDALGQIARLSRTTVDIGPTTRQRLGVTGQVLFPDCWVE